MNPVEESVLADAESDVALAKRTDPSVLIVANTGTAHNIAHRIHAESARRHGPWVAIAGGMSSSDDVTASFERARGGTLFIDDIERLSVWQQRRLLTLFDVRVKSAATDGPGLAPRVIAGASRALVTHLESHRFSDRLFYRLNIIRIDAAARRT